MTKHSTIIEELDREMKTIAAMSMKLTARQVRVTQNPPGATPVDITSEFAEGLRTTSNALLKAVAALKNVDAAG